MLAVEAAHAVVGLLARRRRDSTVQHAADQVAQRVAAERVAAEQDDVRDQHQRCRTPDAVAPVAGSSPNHSAFHTSIDSSTMKTSAK